MNPPSAEASPPQGRSPGHESPAALALADPAKARIGVIRNPTSHYNRNAAPDDINLPHVLRVVPKKRPEIALALREFAGQGIDLLVIDGGDGTVRDVLTEGREIFGANWPVVLVLPSGKTNALALDLGVPKKLKLRAALAAIDGARIVRRKPILVERQDDRGKPVLGFLFGAGVFNATIDAGQVAHRLGAFQSAAVGLTAVASIFQALFGIGENQWRRLVPMRLRLDGEKNDMPRSSHGRKGMGYALGISTLQRFPLGMRPFGKVAGELRFIVWDAPLRRIIALVPVVLMGWDPAFLRRLGLLRGSADELRLTLETSFILDGEAFPPGELRISPGHEVQFLVP